jgi:mono/diheme cytochrome c family protein
MTNIDKWILGAAAPLVLTLAGCSAAGRPSKVEAGLANFAKDVVIPLEARSRPNPIAGDAAAAVKGATLYQQSCAVCHGGDGRSETAVGRGLYPPAMDLTSPHVRRWNDAEMFWIIRNGVRFTGMPAWKDLLDEDQTWQVVAAVRELQKAPAKALAPEAHADGDLLREGELLFRQENCIGCHRLHGEGGTLGPDLSREGDRGRADEWLLGHFLKPADYVAGSIMPPASNLNRRQLQALTLFLQRQKQGR